METPKIDFAKGLKGTSEFIKNNPKPLLIVGGAIAAVVIGVVLTKSISGGISSLFKRKKVTGGTFSKQPVDQTRTTISDQTAKNYAENMYQAFNYDWGTDNTILNAIFSKINSEDFKQIYNAFGTRTYNQLAGGTPNGDWWNLTTYGIYDDLDLVAWLNTELDNFDTALKKKARPIVEGAGFILEK